MRASRLDAASLSWQVWIDTGGTFTDCLGRGPDGTLRRAKVLSSSALRGHVVACADRRVVQVRVTWDTPADFVRGFEFRILAGDASPPRVVSGGIRVASHRPEAGILELDQPAPFPIEAGAAFEVLSPEEAPVLGARMITRTPADVPLPPLEMRLATTRGTNALLERRGARTALFITRGFADLPRIGTQQRPDLFALDIRKPAPLHERVVEVAGRIDASGAILEPLDEAGVLAAAREVLASGIRIAAVTLMHAWRNPSHERRLAELLEHAGFERVSVSSRLSSSIQILPRAETAIVDACLGPVVGGYLDRVRGALDGGSLLVMTSAGGLVRAESFDARDSLLSGPAGGVVGSALSGRASGVERLIAFDMGGTSTDVSRFDGDFEYCFEYEVGGVHLVAPALSIATVASGGGSICGFERGRLVVGPESAGADPGPACYGSGGPLTLTDVNLLLDRLAPDRFGIPIDRGAAQRAFDGVRERLRAATGEAADATTLLEGYLDLANERMADAIRSVSLSRGYDPAEYALVAFGGAGGQHAAAVAEKLGIARVLVPDHAGLLSAFGIGHAAIERFAEEQVLRDLDDAGPALDASMEALAARARERVREEGVPEADIVIRRRIALLRFAGQDSSITLEIGRASDVREAFRKRHAEIFGHCPVDRAIEVVSLRAVASSRPHAPKASKRARPFAAEPLRRLRMRAGGKWREGFVFDRESLKPGATIRGPALVVESHSTTVVEPGWDASVDAANALVLTRKAPAAANALSRSSAVNLELFTNRFRAIALEMGEMLRRTAVSTNIKERLDFSCALLDARGDLVVNAPHIPVHLGALGLCVKNLVESVDLEPGDVWVTNHPAFGGSHLPDVTVVTPVHDDRGALLGFVASRAHHAEIGGRLPGSMPPMSANLAEEGVVIPPVRLVTGGVADWTAVERLLREAPWPSRAVRDNLADLGAALAANRRGAEQLVALAAAHGKDVVAGYMAALGRHAEDRVRAALARLPMRACSAREVMDDGTVLAVSVTLSERGAVVDFAGTSDVHPGNLNATPAIVRSCVIYVVRLLVDEPLPLNEGLLRAVEIRVPRGLLDPAFDRDPTRAPAVVGGNVETSQRLVDTLIKALGICAGSQGTMNNVTFGSEAASYYETVCGGAGAGPGFHGASGVHTHMTNTRITDPEVLEHRYPVRVERFALRPGSGGQGRFRGGDGVIREITFLAPMSLAIVSERRVAGAFGLDGGEAGEPGRQHLVRSDGAIEVLGSRAAARVEPGDRFVLETPGGGGCGQKENRPA